MKNKGGKKCRENSCLTWVMSGILCQASPPTSPKITRADKFNTAFHCHICGMSSNRTALLRFGQNVISESDFRSQAGQTENKQTSLDEKSLLAKACSNAKPHARWSGSSFFALWEPLRKNIGERERLSFMMLQKTKKWQGSWGVAPAKFTWSHVFVFMLICWSQQL